MATRWLNTELILDTKESGMSSEALSYRADVSSLTACPYILCLSLVGSIIRTSSRSGHVPPRIGVMSVAIPLGIKSVSNILSPSTFPASYSAP